MYVLLLNPVDDDAEKIVKETKNVGIVPILFVLHFYEIVVFRFLIL